MKNEIKNLLRKQVNMEINKQINCRIIEKLEDTTIYEGTKEPNKNLGKSGDIFIKSLDNK